MKRKFINLLSVILILFALLIPNLVMPNGLALSSDTLTLRPNANGTLQEYNNQFPASGSHYDKVDEAVADDSTTYIYNTVTSYKTDTFGIPNHTTETGTINYVKVYYKHLEANGQAAYTKAAVYTHTTLYVGTAYNSGGSWAVSSHQWDTNPNTSSAWTWDEIDALEIGVSGIATALPAYSNVTQVYVEVNYTTNVPPTVTSVSSSNVEETTASCTGNITDIGGGNVTSRGIQYGYSTGTYTANVTETGTYGVGTFTGNLTGLTEGATVFWRAFAANAFGIAYGSELTFHTKPLAPTGFTATAGDTQVALAWTKGVGSENTTIVGKIGSYPADRTDGTLVYSNTGTSVNHTGLTNGNHWYYRAWAYSINASLSQYSDTYAQADATPTTVTIGSIMTEGKGRNWAVLRGQVVDDGGTTVTSVGVDYGLTDAYGSSQTETGVSLNTGDYFVVTIRNLTPATTYHWRAKSGAFTGGDLSFSTTGSPSIREYLNSGGDGDSSANISGIKWVAQQFTTDNVSHTVTNIRLSLKKVGSPGTITVSIKHANSSNEPTGLDIVSGTFNGNDLLTSYSTIDIEVDEGSLEGAAKYAIVIRALAGDASNYVKWQMDTGGGLANAVGLTSSNGGVTWVSDTPADYLFEIWGNDNLKVYGGGVFGTYIETGDLMFAADVFNEYEPYYPDYITETYFDLQLYDTDGVTLIASTPLWDWGRRPASLYLSASASTPLTLGSAYYLKLVGSANPTAIIASYQLENSDWYGTDLTYLDKWVITLARKMEVYYSGTYVTYVVGKGTVLNETGGVIFDTGISGLSYVRPDLFKTVRNLPTYTAKTFSNAYEAATDWETQVGSSVATKMTAVGTIFGIDGKAVIGLILGAILVLVAMGTGQIIWGIIGAIPILLWGNELRVIPIALTALLGALAVYIFIFRTWWSKT